MFANFKIFIQLPPGFGKTVMALYLISKLKVKTLIIVHKEFLMNQWKERIAQYIPNCSVGIIKQKKVESNNDIVIASLQSLCMRSYDEDVFKDFGFLIIDECHHVGAQVFSKALFKVNFKYTLGLSATGNFLRTPISI
jgi:superfamily II DNA or RNA helicase